MSTYTEVDVERADLRNLCLGQLEGSDCQVLDKTIMVVRFRNDGKTPLDCPAKQNLSSSCGVHTSSENPPSIRTVRTHSSDSSTQCC